jgi:hypothetical protein
MSGQLKLKAASLGGDIALVPTDTASSVVITVPAATGTMVTTATAGVPIGGPAFSAYQTGSAQVLTAGVWTKLVINTEEFDTNNNFDPTTNYRFTPTVAGYYQISATVQFAGAAYCGIAIYKNGTAAKTGTIQQSTGIASGMSALIYMNGSTDYVETYAFSTVTATLNIGVSSTYFQGCLVRSAT